MTIFIKIIILALVLVSVLIAYATGAIMEEKEAISGTFNPIYKEKLHKAVRVMTAICGAIFMVVSVLVVAL